MGLAAGSTVAIWGCSTGSGGPPPWAAADGRISGGCGHPVDGRDRVPAREPILDRPYLNSRFDEPIGDVAGGHATSGGARIGVAGASMNYSLSGLQGIDNNVEYVSVPPSSPLSFVPPRTCGGWRSALHTGRFDYVVLGPWLEGQGSPRGDGVDEGRRCFPGDTARWTDLPVRLDARVSPSPCTDRVPGGALVAVCDVTRTEVNPPPLSAFHPHAFHWERGPGSSNTRGAW
jgi:hypothetical protein